MERNMPIENHKEEVPFAYYQEKFAGLDAREVLDRLGVPLENGAFAVTLLGVPYRISYPGGAVCAVESQTPPPLPTQTFLLRYLLEGKPAAPTEEFRTFREMPWGELYIKPFTGRVLSRAAFTFGTRLNAFRAAAERLGGMPLKHADAAYEFRFLGEYRLRLLLWEGDDEFPPNAQLLYTASFLNFAAEDRVVAGDLLLNALKAAL